ncbi:MAG: hypothetical protein ABIN24_09355 [Dyadobacter sp.]
MKNTLLIMFCLLTLQALAQNRKEVEAAKEFQAVPAVDDQIHGLAIPAPQKKALIKGELDSNDDRGFLDFYVPTAILAFGIEPASISKVNLGITDTKFSFKYGFRTGDTTATKKLRSGLGIAFGAKLSDGARVLFSSDETPREFSLSLIHTLVIRDVLYFVTNKRQEKLYSSSNARWINTSVSGSISEKNVFSGDTTYSKHKNFNGQILLSFSNLFNSLYGKYKWGRNIINIGAGYGFFDNYESLKSYTLRRSIINVNQGYIGESKSIIGKRGDFKKLNGVIGTISAFYPLTSPTKLTSLIIGANGNIFGVASDNYSANINAGFF